MAILSTFSRGAILMVLVSCGSGRSGSAWSGGGASGSGGASSSGSAGSGGASAGPWSGLGDASTSVGVDGAAPEACTVPGNTRSCCGGTQTCTGNEFPVWGACLDNSGAPAMCAFDAGRPLCGNINEGTQMVCDAGPPPPPPPPNVCADPTLNTEPEILAAFSPDNGQTVDQTGQIKVWVCDEHPPFIAPGEQVDNTTGAITMPGDRTAMAGDGLLYEPALYIAPQSPTNGGMPPFPQWTTGSYPQWIKGSYNNNPPKPTRTASAGATPDPLPAGASWCSSDAPYRVEFIWDVSSLGLQPGAYTAVFSIHDGDGDRAIACVTIVIT